MVRRECLFCNRTGHLTNEHIVPKWLHDVLRTKKEQLSSTHLSTYGLTVSQRRHSGGSLLSGLVCGQCNHGWMNTLESEVKDIITPLIDLNISANLLGKIKERNKKLALWSLKIVDLLNYSTNYRKIVPRFHFYSLYKGKIPKGVFINFAFTKNERDETIAWRQSQTTIVIPGDSHEADEVMKRGFYKTTLQFRHLLIRVSYMPINEFAQDTRLEKSILIWPQVYRYNNYGLYKDIDEFDLGNSFVKTK